MQDRVWSPLSAKNFWNVEIWFYGAPLTSDVLPDQGWVNEKKSRKRNWKVKHQPEMFLSMNMSASFKNIFQILWYSSLPCYYVKGVTSEHHQQRASWRLDACYWKGLRHSAIFKTYLKLTFLSNGILRHLLLIIINVIFRWRFTWEALQRRGKWSDNLI